MIVRNLVIVSVVFFLVSCEKPQPEPKKIDITEVVEYEPVLPAPVKVVQVVKSTPEVLYRPTTRTRGIKPTGIVIPNRQEVKVEILETETDAPATELPIDEIDHFRKQLAQLDSLTSSDITPSVRSVEKIFTAAVENFSGIRSKVYQQPAHDQEMLDSIGQSMEESLNTLTASVEKSNLNEQQKLAYSIGIAQLREKVSRF